MQLALDTSDHKTFDIDISFELQMLNHCNSNKSLRILFVVIPYFGKLQHHSK